MPSTSNALETWASEQRRALPERIQNLIQMAKWDLYHGPTGPHHGDKDWPGYAAACAEIKTALEKFDEVWVDTDSDDVMTSAPEAFMCENVEYDPDDPESEREVLIEPRWEDIVKVEAISVKAAIVGDTPLAFDLI